MCLLMHEGQRSEIKLVGIQCLAQGHFSRLGPRCVLLKDGLFNHRALPDALLHLALV